MRWDRSRASGRSSMPICCLAASVIFWSVFSGWGVSGIPWTIRQLRLEYCSCSESRSVRWRTSFSRLAIFVIHLRNPCNVDAYYQQLQDKQFVCPVPSITGQTNGVYAHSQSMVALEGHTRPKYWRQISWKISRLSPKSRNLTSNLVFDTFPRSRNLA